MPGSDGRGPLRSGTAPPPIACTLTAGDQDERIERWRRLLAGAPRVPIDGGVRFHLAAGLTGAITELASAERECCAFFEFVLRSDAGGLTFEVRAPAEAQAAVNQVFGGPPELPRG